MIIAAPILVPIFLATIPLSLTQFPRVARQEWGNSFRSLYRAFTSGNCGEFYVCSKMFT